MFSVNILAIDATVAARVGQKGQLMRKIEIYEQQKFTKRPVIIHQNMFINECLLFFDI